MIVADEHGQRIGTLTARGGDAGRLRHLATVPLGVAKERWGKGAATAILQIRVAVVP